MSGIFEYLRRRELLEMSDTPLGTDPNPEPAIVIPVIGDGNCLYRAIITSMLWQGVLINKQLFRTSQFIRSLGQEYSGIINLVNEQVYLASPDTMTTNSDRSSTFDVINDFVGIYCDFADTNTRTSESFNSFTNNYFPRDMNTKASQDAIIEYLALCLRECVFAFIKDNYEEYKKVSGANTPQDLNKWISDRERDRDFDSKAWAHVDAYIAFYLYKKHGFDLRYFANESQDKFTGKSPTNNDPTAEAAGYMPNSWTQQRLSPLYIRHTGNHFEALVKQSELEKAFSFSYLPAQTRSSSGSEDESDYSTVSRHSGPTPPPPPPVPRSSYSPSSDESDHENVVPETEIRTRTDSDDEEFAVVDPDSEVEPGSDSEDEEYMVNPASEDASYTEKVTVVPPPRTTITTKPTPPAKPITAQRDFTFAKINHKLTAELDIINTVFDSFIHPENRRIGAVSTVSDASIGAEAPMSPDELLINLLKTACADVNKYITELEDQGLAAAILHLIQQSAQDHTTNKEIEAQIKSQIAVAIQTLGNIRFHVEALAEHFKTKGYYEKSDAHNSEEENIGKFGGFSELIKITQLPAKLLLTARLNAYAAARKPLLAQVETIEKGIIASTDLSALMENILNGLAKEPYEIYKDIDPIMKSIRNYHKATPNTKQAANQIRKIRKSLISQGKDGKENDVFRAAKQEYLAAAEILFSKAEASKIIAQRDAPPPYTTLSRKKPVRRIQAAPTIEHKLAELSQKLYGADNDILLLNKDQKYKTPKFSEEDIFNRVKNAAQVAADMQRQAFLKLSAETPASNTYAKLRQGQLNALLVAMREAFIPTRVNVAEKVNSLFDVLEEINQYKTPDERATKIFTLDFEPLLKLRTNVDANVQSTDFINKAPDFMKVASAMLEEIEHDVPEQTQTIELLRHAMGTTKNAIVAHYNYLAKIQPKVTVTVPVNAHVNYDDFKDVLLKHDANHKVSLYSGSDIIQYYAESDPTDTSVAIKAESNDASGNSKTTTIMKISEPVAVAVPDPTLPRNLATAEVLDLQHVRNSAICFIQSMLEMVTANPLPAGQRYEITVANFNNGPQDNPLQQAEQFLWAYRYVLRKNENDETAKAFNNIRLVFSDEDGMNDVRLSTHAAIQQILTLQQQRKILSDEDLDFLRNRFGHSKKSLRQLALDSFSKRRPNPFDGLQPHGSSSNKFRLR